MSERKACEVVGQPRSTQRYGPAEADDEKALVKRMRELAAEHPRYGYRRVWALLRQEKFEANRKRVHRLWRREGLRVPRKQRKREGDTGTQLVFYKLAASRYSRPSRYSRFQAYKLAASRYSRPNAELAAISIWWTHRERLTRPRDRPPVRAYAKQIVHE